MRSALRFSPLVLLLGMSVGTSGCSQLCPTCGASYSYAPVPVSLASRTAPAVSAADAPAVRFASATSHDATSTPARLPAPTLAVNVCPATAFCYACLLPGGGHFYTGETARGAAHLGIAAGSLAAGALLSSRGGTCTPTAPGDGCEYDHETHQYRRGSSNRTPLYVGAAVAAGSWIYGIVDARNSAARMNARNGVALGPLTAHPEPLVGVAPDGRTELGVRLRLAR